MTYEQEPEVEARMGILPRCGWEAQIQRCLPPLRPAMQTELPGDDGRLSRVPFKENRRRQKNVGIKVEKKAFSPL